MDDSGHGEPIAKLSVDVHCEKCFKKFRKVLKNFQGVKGMHADFAGHMLTVRGWVDPNDLKERIERKIHRSVEIVQPKKEQKEKKENKARFEEKAAAMPMTVKKKEKEVIPLGAEEDDNSDGPVKDKVNKKNTNEVESPELEQERLGSYGGYSQHYGGYGAAPSPPREYYGRNYPPTCFSDENPNGCSVM